MRLHNAAMLLPSITRSSSSSSFRSLRCNCRILSFSCRAASSSSSSTQLRHQRSSSIRPAAGTPDGQAIAVSTAERYNIDSLRKALWDKALLGRGDGKDAMNLMGEAIWIPYWPLPEEGSASSEESSLPKDITPEDGQQTPGEIFIFESGSYVTWHMSEESARSFGQQVLQSTSLSSTLSPLSPAGGPIEIEKYKEPQTEEMDFIIRAGEKTGVREDVIYIGTSELDNRDLPIQHHPQNNNDKHKRDSGRSPLATAIEPISAGTSNRSARQNGSKASIPQSVPSSDSTTALITARARLPRSEDDLRARLSLSIGLARSTKLAVYEQRLDDFMDQFAAIPSQLASGSDAPLNKRAIVSQTGNLLLIRQYLNLSTTSTNLLDAPEIFWEDHGPALELWFKEITRALEVKTRLDNLNRKLDYCLQVQETLQNLESTKVSHRLEWIIIILIAIEIGLALIREGIPGIGGGTKLSHTQHQQVQTSLEESPRKV